MVKILKKAVKRLYKQKIKNAEMKIKSLNKRNVRSLSKRMPG